MSLDFTKMVTGQDQILDLRGSGVFKYWVGGFLSLLRVNQQE